MTDTDFERKWLRLLRVDRRAADVLRREHNRDVIRGLLYIFEGPKFSPDFAGEEVVRMENGRATTLRSTIPE